MGLLASKLKPAHEMIGLFSVITFHRPFRNSSQRNPRVLGTTDCKPLSYTAYTGGQVSQWAK